MRMLQPFGEPGDDPDRGPDEVGLAEEPTGRLDGVAVVAPAVGLPRGQGRCTLNDRPTTGGSGVRSGQIVPRYVPSSGPTRRLRAWPTRAEPTWVRASGSSPAVGTAAGRRAGTDRPAAR